MHILILMNMFALKYSGNLLDLYYMPIPSNVTKAIYYVYVETTLKHFCIQSRLFYSIKTLNIGCCVNNYTADPCIACRVWPTNNSKKYAAFSKLLSFKAELSKHEKI